MKALPSFTPARFADIEQAIDRVYCCDALHLLRSLPDASIDLTVTSPPYDNLRTYNGFTWDFQGIARELYRVMKPGGVVVWVVADATIDGSETLTSMRQAIYFVDACGFKMHDTMIYEVAGTGAKGSNLGYWQAWEYMFVLAKGGVKTVNRIADVKNATKEFGVRTNIWRYKVGFMDSSDKTEHPAPYPEALAQDHIRTWSNSHDIVLDPFMGSGTTAKMARNLGRHFIGGDLSPEYVAIANRRLAQPYTLPMFDRVSESGVA